MAYTMILKAGLKDVVMPNGLRYQGNGTTTLMLSDEETAQLSVTAIANLLVASSLTHVA